MSLRLYHVTTREAALLIAEQGFRDEPYAYDLGEPALGVQFEDSFSWPLHPDYMSPVWCEVVVEEADVSEFRLPKDGQSDRGWLVPAAVANTWNRRLLVQGNGHDEPLSEDERRGVEILSSIICDWVVSDLLNGAISLEPDPGAAAPTRKKAKKQSRLPKPR